MCSRCWERPGRTPPKSPTDRRRGSPPRGARVRSGSWRAQRFGWFLRKNRRARRAGTTDRKDSPRAAWRLLQDYGSAPEALSADGRSMLLSEILAGAGKSGSIYLRNTDGSDAARGRIRRGSVARREVGADHTGRHPAPLGSGADRCWTTESSPRTAAGGTRRSELSSQRAPDRLCRILSELSVVEGLR